MAWAKLKWSGYLLFLILVMCACVDRENVLVFSTLPDENTMDSCLESPCDGVGNINGEVDWIEPSQVEDPALLMASKASGMINIDKGAVDSL